MSTYNLKTLYANGDIVYKKPYGAKVKVLNSYISGNPPSIWCKVEYLEGLAQGSQAEVEQESLNLVLTSATVNGSSVSNGTGIASSKIKSKFNLGDKVYYIGNDLIYRSILGKVTDIEWISDPSTKTEIIRYKIFLMEGFHKHSTFGPIEEKDLILDSSIHVQIPNGPYTITLPNAVNIQIPKSGWKGDDDLFGIDKAKSKSELCDCGGFKTYGTLDAASHSRWCSLLKTIDGSQK